MASIMLCLNLPNFPHLPKIFYSLKSESCLYSKICVCVCEMSTDIRKDLQNYFLQKLDQAKSKMDIIFWNFAALG